MNAVWRWLGWVLPATPRERAAALWSFAYFFNTARRPSRIAATARRMGIAGGVKIFAGSFTATFVTLYRGTAGRPGVRRNCCVHRLFIISLPNVALFACSYGIVLVIVARVFCWGRACSVGPLWLCSGCSWPTCSPRRKVNVCSVLSAPAALLAAFWARSSRWGCRCRSARSIFWIVAAVLLELAVFCVLSA